jgi:hypothetical protein
MDFKKIIEIGKIPIIAIVAISIIVNLLALVPALVLLALPLGLVSLALLAYAGYLAGKAKMDLVSTGVAGLVVAVISGLLNAVVNLVFMFAGVGPNAALLALGLVIFVIGVVIGLVLNAVFGFILGIIGGFIAQKF